MVWQERVGIIVMLTKTLERNKVSPASLLLIMAAEISD